MLRDLVYNKLPTKLLIIADTEEAKGCNLFASALKSDILEDSIKKINLLCHENQPSYYLPSISLKNKEVIVKNYFADPLRWNDPSAPNSDLSSFTSNPTALASDIFFLDSFTLLAEYHGYHNAYKVLSALKDGAAKTVCLVHRDVLDDERVQELRFLATAFVALGETSGGEREKLKGEKLGEVVYKRTGGKVVKQAEVFSVDEELNVASRVSETKPQKQSNARTDLEGLTTFRLGFRMSEKERRAKKELVLPYVKHKEGKIIYEEEAGDLEDDPDDDLDI